MVPLFLPSHANPPELVLGLPSHMDARVSPIGWMLEAVDTVDRNMMFLLRIQPRIKGVRTVTKGRGVRAIQIGSSYMQCLLSGGCGDCPLHR